MNALRFVCKYLFIPMLS